MKIRQSIFLLTALAMIAALVGCSSSSNTKTPPVISVAIPTPVTTLQTSAQAAITANVTNDSANAGVTWSCAPSGACGSFSPTSTASGAQTTYTAPSAVPTGNTVTVTATSVTDPTKSASANITITAAGGIADGSYVFSLTGESAATAAPFSVAGVFTVNGGLITGGEQDINNAATIETDLINGTGSTVSTTADGNLQIVLTTCNGTDCTGVDTGAGLNGVETFNGSLFCTCKALLTEFDGSATASGTLDLQTPSTAPSGGYAFAIAGSVFDAAISANVPLAVGGILDVTANPDGTGTVSVANSIFDANDTALPAPSFAQTFASGTVSAQDSFGRVTFTLNPTDTVDFSQILLGGYIVDNTRIRLVEGNDSFAGTTGGTALAQGANTGTFTTIAGNSYVAGLTGFDGNGVLQAAGVLAAGGSGTSGGVTGTISYNDLTAVTLTPANITGGTYTLDATGRVTMTGVTDGTNTFNLQIYLTGDGHALAITMDASDALAGLGFAQNGSGSYSAASFSSSYAMNAGGTDINETDEFDAVGPITADGISALTLPSGTGVDLNWLFNSGAVAGLTVSGSFATTANTGTSGVLTGTMTGLDVTTTANTDAFTYYLVTTTASTSNPQVVVAIETDTNQLTLAYFQLLE